jgi:hypothetical protein
LTTDDFFSGRRQSSVTRKYVFADRAPEKVHILRRTAAVTDSVFYTDVLDYQRSASNLTVLWGTGGVGKSALLNEIRREFDERTGNECASSTIAIDYSDHVNRDFESILIKIRGSLAKLDRRWPAFDLVFSNYWIRKHPGVDLLRFIDGAGFLDREQREAVIDQLSAVLEIVLGGIGIAGATYKIFSTLKQKMSDSRTTKRLLESCPPFRILMNEADPDRMLGYMPSVLSYDLEEVRKNKCIRVLCTLDTMEYIQRASRERGSAEDLASRLVYLMPNVAFVAASRIRFDWAKESGRISLTYGGPERWPDLRSGGDGQFQMEGLEDSYANQLLQESLELGGRPAIPENLRQQIVRGAAGLPLHLELSMTWFRDMEAYSPASL